MKSETFQFRSMFFALLLILSSSSFCFAGAWQQPPEQLFFTMDSDSLTGATDGNGNAIAAWNSQSDPGVYASAYISGEWGTT